MPRTSARRAAFLCGAVHYSTGLPCWKGHVAPRFTKSGVCTVCSREHVLARLAAKPKAIKPTAAERLARKLATNAAWCAANPERNRANKRRWEERNPEAVRARCQAARARRKHAQGRYTAADVRALLERQGSRCALCDTSVVEDRHIDHIVPLSRGGSNWPSNLQILCPPCNRRKGGKMPAAHV